MLIQNGADVDAVDHKGRRAIHIASRDGHVEIVKVLLENGAFVDPADDLFEDTFMLRGMEPLRSSTY